MLNTPFFAAIFTIFYIYLSFAVIRHRIANQVALGDSDHPELMKAVRIHGNFIEYVPLALILFWILETMYFANTLVLVLGLVLLVARILHMLGMRNSNLIRLRQIGVISTFLVLLISAVMILWHYLPIG